jgi:MoaA/NifB/PqqE/SkfB family radical SAM enzyme
MKIGIETVAMRSNINALPELVEQFGKRGVDSILVSHVFPYHAQLETEMLYTLMSSEAWEVFETIGDIDAQDWFGIARNRGNSPNPVSGITRRQALILEQARTDGITLNYALYQAVKKRAPEFKNTQLLFDQAASNAQRYGMQLDLPPLLGSLQKRACPYVQAQAAVIRSDGAVVPCFKNLYPHSAYFNGRTRSYTPHVFGSLAQMSFTDIWNSAQYRQFRDDMNNMNEHIAWCGDCSFSLYYCYFSEKAPHDCMLNEPFCADCPFSLNLTRCVL